MTGALLAHFLALALLPVAAQPPRPEPVGPRPDAPIYAMQGPDWVGTQDLVIPGPATGGTLPATLWNPAQHPTGNQETCCYEADARQMSAEASGLVATLSGSPGVPPSGCFPHPFPEEATPSGLPHPSTRHLP